jgi:imidazolonepropionase-like amidohydrolase
MADVLFRNANLFDGTGAALRPADVIVRGNRIRTVADANAGLEAPGCEIVDATGLTLMPGMTEGHAHLSFCGGSKNTDFGDIPPEEHLLGTMRNAELLLDHGFTSVYSAASAKLRLDVVIRNEIDGGRLKGPRIRASGPEITVTGGLGDDNRVHQARESFGMIANGPDEIRKAVRLCIREGCDNVKINISGDDFVNPAKGAMTVMSEAEVSAAVEAAHDFGKRVNCHARAGGSVVRALKCGVDVIYHCELMDERALDMMEARKADVFAGPAIGLIHNTIEFGPQFGIDEPMIEKLGMRRVIEKTSAVYAELRKRGVRVVIGGDYGFAWTPQGTNARDLEHFVTMFGYSPAEALVCATKVGGEIMDMGDELGLVREGYLADLLLVQGDPTRDVRIMQDRERLLMVMKDGAFHRHPRDAARREPAVAAE